MLETCLNKEFSSNGPAQCHTIQYFPAWIELLHTVTNINTAWKLILEKMQLCKIPTGFRWWVPEAFDCNTSCPHKVWWDFACALQRLCCQESFLTPPVLFLFQASAFPLETTTLKLVASEATQRPPGTVESVAAGNGATQDHRAGLDAECAAPAATSKCNVDGIT